MLIDFEFRVLHGTPLQMELRGFCERLADDVAALHRQPAGKTHRRPPPDDDRAAGQLFDIYFFQSGERREIRGGIGVNVKTA